MVEVIPAGCWFSVVGIFSIQHSTPAELLRCAGPRPRPVYQVPQKPPPSSAELFTTNVSRIVLRLCS
jgi:hypothetical protein